MILKMIYFDEDGCLQKTLEMRRDEVWDTGICLDDWDYGIIITGHVEVTCELEKLLQGPCDNIWYKVRSKNSKKPYTIGMAYHS